MGGYKILLDCDASKNGSDGGGFNGITMRWLELANIHGLLSSSVQAWAVANIT